jgi:diguanylate cyclase (GGDEF)-like protein
MILRASIRDMATTLIDLVLPFGHSALISTRRAELILSRVRWVAFTFAVLTPLWIGIDVWFFPSPVWRMLAMMRLVASGGFTALAAGFRRRAAPRRTMLWRARMALAILLGIPTLFFFLSVALLSRHQLTEVQSVLAVGYVFLPFVLIAGLSVFPLTAIEGALFAAPMVLAMLIVARFHVSVLPFDSALGALWLLGLLATVAILADMSQLHFMIALIRNASRDQLTQAYSRRVGEELLDTLFERGMLASEPLSVAFVDLDDFKEINDRFGHEEGDLTLRRVGAALRGALRQDDVVIRWGGEEFLLVLPNTELEAARVTIERLRRDGFGRRADGTRQTASIGLAECRAERIESWSELIERADQRMYHAKQSGKDQAVSVDLPADRSVPGSRQGISHAVSMAENRC